MCEWFLLRQSNMNINQNVLYILDACTIGNTYVYGIVVAICLIANTR